MLLPACLMLSAGTVVAQNIPEIVDAIRAGDRKARGGAAVYVATETITRGVKWWLVAITIRKFVNARLAYRYAS